MRHHHRNDRTWRVTERSQMVTCKNCGSRTHLTIQVISDGVIASDVRYDVVGCAYCRVTVSAP